MHEPNSNSGLNATAAISVLLALLLLLGGVGYVVKVRQEQEAARAEAVAKLAELQAQARLMSADQRAALSEQKARFEEYHFGISNKPAIRSILQAQQQAWNAGDIDQFMAFYWKSDDLTFSSGGKVTRGWQATLNGYKQRYSTRQHMGVLDFSNLEITMLGRASALVLGEWKLTRDTGDIGGKFSLVLREIDGQWLIIHDHTSKGESTSASAD